MASHIRGGDRISHRQLMERIFRLRYQIFVVGRQWSLPSTNGMEIDQYDCPEAAYFYDQEDDGTISAHVRLTPTKTHSLLADYFPHLCEGDTDPRGETIWECTRYIVRPSKKSRERNRIAKAELVVTMLEWCKANGITHIQTVIDTATFPTFVEMTSETKPLGLSHLFGGGPEVPGGGECMAWRWPVTDKVIDDIRRYGGLDCSTCLERPCEAAVHAA
jgi:acyl-homoserine lactone synthase